MDETQIAEIRKWSWGALFLTPLWLFRNGFWITAAVCGVLAFAFPPAAFLISLLFFLFGARWSWGGGKRWKSFEEFASSQWNWNIVGIIFGISYLIIGLFIAAPFIWHVVGRA